MKKVNVMKGVFAIAAIAFLSAGAFAQGKVVISKYLDTDYAVVTVLNDTESNFNVKLLDDEGMELYSSPTVGNSEAFQKLFDLRSFVDGNYKLVFENSYGKVNKPFMVFDNELVLPKAKVVAPKEVVPKVNPYVRQDGNNLYVSHLNFDKSSFSISIDDYEGNEIYSSSLPRKTSYTGLFDISNLPKGQYSVMLTSGKQKYYYEIKK